ncbi:MAG TPA: metallophosphoesterase [Burkholderiaceae bacterium]|nr:metallophosphoesterase [Burkholderiaceae bacterium]
MRLLVLSDLHVEHVAFDAAACGDAFDLVVLGGDVGQATLAVQWARRAFPHHPIVQIAGNHEFFHARRDAALDAMRETARRLEVAFLEREEVAVGGVSFLGCTLWTDWKLHETPGRPVRMAAAEVAVVARRVMLDYRYVEEPDPAAPGGVRAFSPEDSAIDHEASRRWLAERLARPATGPRVVVTHHLPSWRSVSPEYVAAPSNPAFASDVDAMFPAADLWIHGHTHSSHDYFAAGCRVVCNPRGYPMRGGGFENPRFDPRRVVEVPAARGTTVGP